MALTESTVAVRVRCALNLQTKQPHLSIKSHGKVFPLVIKLTSSQEWE